MTRGITLIGAGVITVSQGTQTLMHCTPLPASQRFRFLIHTNNSRPRPPILCGARRDDHPAFAYGVRVCRIALMVFRTLCNSLGNAVLALVVIATGVLM